MSHSLEEVLGRLERLWRKLDEDGRYIDADTILLATALLRTGLPEIIGPLPELSADEAYDRETFESDFLDGPEQEPDEPEGRNAV